MSVNQKIHQLKLNEWTARFSEQKSSGLSAKQWCVQNGFSIHAYNYWKHLLKEEHANQLLPDVVPLSLPTAPAAVLPADVQYSWMTGYVQLRKTLGIIRKRPSQTWDRPFFRYSSILAASLSFSFVLSSP